MTKGVVKASGKPIKSEVKSFEDEILQASINHAKRLQLGIYHGYREITDDDRFLTEMNKAHWNVKALATYGKVSQDIKVALERFSSLFDETKKKLGVNVSVKGRWYYDPFHNFEVRIGNPETYEDFGSEEDFILKNIYEGLTSG